MVKAAPVVLPILFLIMIAAIGGNINVVTCREVVGSEDQAAVPVVKPAGSCSVALAQCDASCDQKCKAAHPGGDGSCDWFIGFRYLCKCDYPCD